MLAVALDHHRAQAGGLLERVDGGEQALDQLAVIGVVDLRPVENDLGDAARVDVP
jgi:hypothetical protein